MRKGIVLAIRIVLDLEIVAKILKIFVAPILFGNNKLLFIG